MPQIDWNQLLQWGAALGVLVGGWIVALIITAIVRWLLRRLNLDKNVAIWTGQPKGAKPMPLESWIGTGVFYVLMIVVLVLFFQYLAPTFVTTGPLAILISQVINIYLPQLINAAALVVVAFLIASALRWLIIRLLAAVKFDERIGGQVGKGAPSVSNALAEAVYWLVYLFFLPAILGALNQQQLLDQVQSVVNKLVGYLPNILGAGVVLFIGWLVARILQRIVTSLLAAAGTDRFSDRVGISKSLGTQKLSELIGLVVYILVFVPVIVQALQTLQFEAISGPATDMLKRMSEALPSVLSGILVVVLAYVFGRIVANLAANLLTGLGFDTLPARLGLGKAVGKGQRTPSEIAGYVVLAAIMLFAIIQGAQIMGLTAFASLAETFLGFATNVVVALVIFTLGLWLANLAADAVKSSGSAQAGVLAFLARAGILVLAGFVALSQTGLASNIINYAFLAVFGAMGVAAALAFGLGGRDIAASVLDDWMKQIKKR